MSDTDYKSQHALRSQPAAGAVARDNEEAPAQAGRGRGDWEAAGDGRVAETRAGGT